MQLDPAQFSAKLKALKPLKDVAKILDELTNIAGTEISFVQSLQLAREVESIAPLAPPDRVVRLAIVSSCTCNHLASGIQLAGLKRGLIIKVWCGQFGQYQQELVAPSNVLKEFGPDFFLFSFHAEHFYSDLQVSDDSSAIDEILQNRFRNLTELWRIARSRFQARVIQQTFLDVTEPLFGNFDQLVEGSPFRLTQRLNQLLTEYASEQQIGVLDIARQSARDGLDKWYSHTHWLQGKMEITPEAVRDYGEHLVRYISSTRGLSRKCLVMDLDNTLWGGVVGDDGVEGLELGEGSAMGEAFLNVQRFAKRLRDRGIILAVCSKNELVNAQAPFLDHPDMCLKLEDITVFIANWDDKAKNIQGIAETLNLGLESLVFVDDNPAERARVRETLPSVAVPELPKDPSEYLRCLANMGYFEASAFTSEDQERAHLYSMNTKRSELKATSLSLDEYLKNLQMDLTYGPLSKVDLVRATQLIGKTNQFNTTTKRYSLEEVTAFASSTNYTTLQCRLSDRFGDNGLVSVMILSANQENTSSLEILNWVMSCRVFGRQLENEMMNIIVEQAKKLGKQYLIGEFLPTQKNTVIDSLYAELGFQLSRKSQIEGVDVQYWKLFLGDYIPARTQISRKDSEWKNPSC